MHEENTAPPSAPPIPETCSAESSDPVVISATAQEFQGRRYWLCGIYFQRRSHRLHRDVWASANGPIPASWHIHHVNGDPHDNRLANLRLVTPSEHVRQHPVTDAQREARRANAAKATAGNRTIPTERRAAAASRGWVNRARVELACAVCGKAFVTARPEKALYCGGACKQTALRRRRRSNT